MTPGARVQAAIEILDLWQSGEPGLDRILAGWGRANRYAGSGDRRAIADLVHDAVRRLRSAAWMAGAEEPATGRQIMIGSLALDDLSAPERLFTGDRHAPAPLTGDERDRLGRPLDEAPRSVQLDLPEWLLPHLAEVPHGALAVLRSRAPLFLRVNRLKTDPAAAIAALAAEQIEAAHGPGADACLRVLAGAAHVSRSRAYGDGLVEIQDASSQAAAAYALAKPGERVLDYCAGAGGKALALAAETGGEVHAYDIAPQRLAQIADRAARAGARITCHTPASLAALCGQCDLVFVDAPCSGSGAWRRNPDAKWRFTPEALHALLQVQRSILAEAAAMVRPGGRLVYATCAILADENQPQVDYFLRANPGFERGREALELRPGAEGDGFFACEILRQPF